MTIVSKLAVFTFGIVAKNFRRGDRGNTIKDHFSGQSGVLIAQDKELVKIIFLSTIVCKQNILAEGEVCQDVVDLKWQNGYCKKSSRLHVKLDPHHYIQTRS